jgi:hydrogenase maturation protease
MTAGPLVIGYGNALRCDDGLGPRAVAMLQADRRLAGVTLLARHQLTPDLVLDIHQADFVILIDATHDAPAGVITSAPLGDVRSGGSAWSHHVDPATLVALAGELYGQVPVVVTISVGIGTVDAGEVLSPPVAAAMPRLVDTVASILAARALTHA